MSQTKRNGNVRQFFKPLQQVSIPKTTPPPVNQSGSRSSSRSTFLTSHQPETLNSDDPLDSTSSQQSCSSLSGPPMSLPQSSSNISRGVVPGSDDEEDYDSDSSLEDLDVIFNTNRTAPANIPSVPAPATPRTSRSRKLPTSTLPRSPLTVRTHYKFDLKHLKGTAADDKALEAKERRLEKITKEDTAMGDDEPIAFSNDIHGNILRGLHEEKEEGGGKDVQKVLNAVKRTEALNMGSRWYFFETEEIPTVKRQPFPKASVLRNWKNDLAEPQIRHQTFVSGFAENMVAYGNTLPDEIIAWILDDFCMEEQMDLRNSYSSVLRVSRKQVHRLVTPEVIRKMFKSLGATSSAITLTDKIKPRQEISDAYSHHPWSNVRALIGLINLIAKYLQVDTRLEVICILLRLGIDPVLMERVDLFSLVQTTLHSLCLYIDPELWESSSQTICATLFSTVELPSLRLRIVNSISPTRSPRLHELRRRLALTFYFSSLSKSLHPPQSIISIPALIQRLKDPPFQINRNTDYRELSSLILLLDIAIDDGRAEGMDFSDKEAEAQFNKDVDELTSRFANFGIKASGAANISRMEAAGILNLVERRIEYTVRTRPKPKNMFYEETKNYYQRRESLGGMQKGISNFVKKAK